MSYIYLIERFEIKKISPFSNPMLEFVAVQHFYENIVSYPTFTWDLHRQKIKSGLKPLDEKGWAWEQTSCCCLAKLYLVHAGTCAHVYMWKPEDNLRSYSSMAKHS